MSDAGYQLSETQAQQILDMRLAKLTGLEQEKLTDEYKELLGTIQGLLAILMDADKLLDVIRDELAQIKAQYGDARRTVIQASQEDLDVLDLIAAEDVVVTLSHAGYAKRQPVTIYRAQRRGGKGRSATNMKEEDFVERLWIANTHDTLLAFTSAGRVLPAEGATRCRTSGPERARQADGEPAAAGRGRGGAGRAAGARIRRGIVSCSSRPGNGTVKKTPLDRSFVFPVCSAARSGDLVFDEGDCAGSDVWRLPTARCDIMPVRIERQGRSFRRGSEVRSDGPQRPPVCAA